ncbi:MAG: TolC family protein, partial [Cyanobacteria bacterium REEB67]|nr:TolC family protein [Cyanobacteria bacterium REEB67]
LDITLPRSFVSFGVLGIWEPWDWGRRRDVARVAAKQSDQYQIEMSDYSDRVSVEADNARRALQVREKEIKAAQLLESSGREQLRIAHRRYRSGATLLKDVIEAQAIYSAAVAQNVKAKADYAEALVEYDRAIGKDFD